MSMIGLNLSSLKEKSTYEHYLKTLRYSLYVITHPLDGFWDLTHEKRGSLAAANTILILTLLERIWQLQFTTFQFNHVDWQYVNIFTEMFSIILLFVVWCVGNWALTTLLDGKGTLKKIYMASAYALTPIPLIRIPMAFISNVLTEEEYSFYSVFCTIAMIWAAFLMISGIMQIHEYSIGKTLACIILTIVAMLIIVFLLLLFFSLVSDGITYFVSIYDEIIFRLY